MKNITRNTAYLVAMASLCFSCHECCQDCVNNKCIFADSITVQSSCYDSEQGLVLSATGNDEAHSDQTWTVYVLKDTTDGWTPADIKINEYRNGNITIPDSILLDNQQIIARVMTYCDGADFYSIYFRFFRITSNNCTTWTKSDL